MSKFGTVPLSAVKENLYVRTHLNADHAQHLADLIGGGAKLPAIKVTPAMVVIDGRHRLYAHRLLELKSIDIEIVDDEPTTGDLVAQALLANVGGSLPPTHSDILHAIKQMIESGMQNSVITKHLQTKWPTAVVRRYVTDAHSQLLKEKTLRAQRAVTDDGETIHAAAAKHGVSVDALRAALGGKRRRRTSTADFKGQLTQIFRSRGGQAGAVLRKLGSAYDEGQLTRKQIEEVVGHVERLCRQSTTSVRDWQRRLKVGKFHDQEQE